MSERKGFRVTCEDLETGETGVMVVQAGDFMLIPFEPCHLDSSAKHANGTIQLTLKGYAPQGIATTEQPGGAA